MYVWLRLARTALTARRRGRYRMGERSSLSFRCLPTDIDTNVHLNNARYMMLADIGRIDIFLRAGLLGVARKNGWAPIMGGLMIQHKLLTPWAWVGSISSGIGFLLLRGIKPTEK